MSKIEQTPHVCNVSCAFIVRVHVHRVSLRNEQLSEDKQSNYAGLGNGPGFVESVSICGIAVFGEAIKMERTKSSVMPMKLIQPAGRLQLV